LKVQREAGDRFRLGDAAAAIAVLQEFLGKLPESQLDADKIAFLRHPVESRIQKYRMMEDQKDIDRQVASKKTNPIQTQLEHTQAANNKQKKVAGLMKQFNEYHRQGKYNEAGQYAKLASELDPENPIAYAAVTMSRTQARLAADKAR